MIVFKRMKDRGSRFLISKIDQAADESHGPDLADTSSSIELDQDSKGKEGEDRLGALINVQPGPSSSFQLRESSHKQETSQDVQADRTQSPYSGPIPGYQQSPASSLRTFYSSRSTISSYTSAPASNRSGAIEPVRTGLTGLNPEVFSSEWLYFLNSVGILLGSSSELDWSGRGQHVEYATTEEGQIPLTLEKTIGHSASALVESVKCRRIRLARKRIRCHRTLRKEEAVMEVKHLQRLQHAHLLRIVGTYTFRRDLAILLYPVAEWNLDEFMEETTQDVCQYATSKDWSHLFNISKPRTDAIRQFYGCLSHAVAFIHSNNVKHMDIKPKNILVQRLKPDRSWPEDRLSLNRLKKFKVYLGDFGIARSYQSAADSETDSPTPFTRMYAAPEVVMQETRGYSADIFSLGCVFLEMHAVIVSWFESTDRRVELLSIISGEGEGRGYYAHIDEVAAWAQKFRRARGFHS